MWDAPVDETVPLRQYRSQDESRRAGRNQIEPAQSLASVGVASPMANRKTQQSFPLAN